MPMPTPPLYQLQDWDEFGPRLWEELTALGFRGRVAIRNFELETAEIDRDMIQTGQINRLALVMSTGTDRDASSEFWNANGHDHDHDANPAGKSPTDIIYAYVADVYPDKYLVHYDGPPELFDLTQGLSEAEGILIYDASKLERVAKNEHWFKVPPLEALLMVFTLVDSDDVK